MNQAEKKFLLYAVLAVFVMLTLLLGIINGINFTMAARDADLLTERIAAGSFAQESGAARPQRADAMLDGMGPMGPDSPEMRASVRFFTVALEKDGSAKTVVFNVSAITEEEAVSWATELQKERTGWTHGIYRYRVYRQNGTTCVTVIDQGRELLSAYRILIFSVAGTLLGTLLSFLILRLVGKRLFAPIEEADRKQKQFISNAEKEFVLPLTVISADAELLERTNGPSEPTVSIRRQVRKLSGLVRSLRALSLTDASALAREPVDLSALLTELVDRNRPRFTARVIALEAEIAPDVALDGAPDVLQQALAELIENTLKYARTGAQITLRREGERIRLRMANDAALPDGSRDEVFDRFTLLENAAEGSAGLGLAYVKDAVRSHNGRVSASVENGSFWIKIDL